MKCSFLRVVPIATIVLQTVIIISMSYEKVLLRLDFEATDYNSTLQNMINSYARAHNFKMDSSCSCGLHFKVDTEAAQVFPAQYGQGKKYLTIGIPTIKREGDTYIIKTLKSLLDNMDAEQRKEVVIVILTADLDLERRNFSIQELENNFGPLIRSGDIHVIAPPEELYINFQVTKRTYGQEQPYVEWRSKQNFDYAYLMRYSAPLSLYYMQLEDDVTAAKDYLRSVHQYIDEQKDAWTCLEFSELGFIGKLYRSKDLEKLSQMLIMFFQEQPVDYTYLYFNMMMTQFQKRMRTPTLFQHQGVHSSFPGKIQPLKDRFFDNMVKVYKGDNPPAEIVTTLKTYLNFLPRLPYASAEGYFWCHGSPVAGDFFNVIFERPQALERVVIETGSESHPTDILQHAVLKASLTLAKDGDRLACTNDIELGEFRQGRIEVSSLQDKVKFKVMCLQVVVTANQEPWAIIREVAVFVQHGA